MLILSVSSPAPACLRCSGVSCPCVVDAGCKINDRVSPMFAKWLKSSHRSTARTFQCNAIQCNAIQCNPIQYNNVIGIAHVSTHIWVACYRPARGHGRWTPRPTPRHGEGMGARSQSAHSPPPPFPSQAPHTRLVSKSDRVPYPCFVAALQPNGEHGAGAFWDVLFSARPVRALFQPSV